MVATTDRVAVPRPSESTGVDLRPGQRPVAWLLSTPFLIFFAVFTAVPVVATMVMSFTDFRAGDVASPLAVDGVGFDNYIAALTDEAFQRGLQNTFYFVLVGMPLTIGAGLAVAVLLDRGITRMRAFFRLGFYLPVVTSIVAIAVVWKVILQEAGMLNTVLGWVGISGPNWLGDPNWSMPGLIMMAVWRNFGASMIIFLAGLQSIPADLYEAADVDGASSWHRFRFITLPLLRPTVLFVSVTTMIGYLQFFDEPFVMTEGGPLESTISMGMVTYQSFGSGEYGLASAMSYVTFVIILIVTAIQFRLLRSAS